MASLLECDINIDGPPILDVKTGKGSFPTEKSASLKKHYDSGKWKYRLLGAMCSTPNRRSEIWRLAAGRECGDPQAKAFFCYLVLRNM
jgi:hypothetical protein